jgi:hypothetical protein
MSIVSRWGKEQCFACTEHADEMADVDGADVSEVRTIDESWLTEYAEGLAAFAVLAPQLTIDDAYAWQHDVLQPSTPFLSEAFEAGWLDGAARRCNELLGNEVDG